QLPEIEIVRARRRGADELSVDVETLLAARTHVRRMPGRADPRVGVEGVGQDAKRCAGGEVHVRRRALDPRRSRLFAPDRLDRISRRWRWGRGWRRWWWRWLGSRPRLQFHAERAAHI